MRTGQDYAANNPGSWTCNKCDALPPPDEVTSSQTTPDVSEKIKGFKHKTLKLLQWNCDSLSTKIPELKDRLSKLDIDICLIQETKLRSHDKTPKIPGYGSVRTDRKSNTSGGGLITYIKDTLVFDRASEGCRTATEMSSIRVKIGGKKWIDITNIYVPPHNSTGQTINLATDIIPTSANSIIVGDFNAHSILWDQIHPTDDRGEEIIDWLITKELSVLNEDSAPTRISRITGGMSSPDISLAGCEISKNCDWKVNEALGNSDHLPILITINHQIQHQHVLGSEAKWKRKDVDWPAWSSSVEELCISLPQAQGPCNRVKRLTHILTTAADQHIGKVKPGKNTKCWLTPHVRDGIRTRNQKRKLLGNSDAITERCQQSENWLESNEAEQDTIRCEVKKNLREEWLESCGEVQERINQAKEDSWKNLLEDAVTDAKDSSQLWSIIKSLNGSPCSNSPNEAMKHKKKTITSNQKKADIFAKHYASVSRLKFSKTDKITNLQLKKVLKEAAVYDETSTDSCKPFSLDELKAAISQMKAKGACGPDNISPTSLKALGEHAPNELLSIFNDSFLNGICPQV